MLAVAEEREMADVEKTSRPLSSSPRFSSKEESSLRRRGNVRLPPELDMGSRRPHSQATPRIAKVGALTRGLTAPELVDSSGMEEPPSRGSRVTLDSLGSSPRWPPSGTHSRLETQGSFLSIPLEDTTPREPKPWALNLRSHDSSDNLSGPSPRRRLGLVTPGREDSASTEAGRTPRLPGAAAFCLQGQTPKAGYAALLATEGFLPPDDEPAPLEGVEAEEAAGPALAAPGGLAKSSNAARLYETLESRFTRPVLDFSEQRGAGMLRVLERANAGIKSLNDEAKTAEKDLAENKTLEDIEAELGIKKPSPEGEEENQEEGVDAENGEQPVEEGQEAQEEQEEELEPLFDMKSDPNMPVYFVLSGLPMRAGNGVFALKNLTRGERARLRGSSRAEVDSGVQTKLSWNKMGTQYGLTWVNLKLDRNLDKLNKARKEKVVRFGRRGRRCATTFFSNNSASSNDSGGSAHIMANTATMPPETGSSQRYPNLDR